MSACDPNTVLADGKAFQSLDDRALEIVQAALLSSIEGSGQTPTQLLAAGKGFQSADAGAVAICVAQLLCQISQGTGGSGGQDITSSFADPNGNVTPSDPTKAALYYQDAVAQPNVWRWDVTNQEWRPIVT